MHISVNTYSIMVFIIASQLNVWLHVVVCSCNYMCGCNYMDFYCCIVVK